MEMNELKVPLAKDSKGTITDPIDAIKGESYYCPGCDDEVILKKGSKYRPHFAHKISDNCSYETIIHKTAKQKIVQLVNNYCETKIDSPVIVRVCSDCGKNTELPLPETLTGAVEEKRLDSGYIADVVLKEGEAIVAAVEIKVTHAVDKKKEENIGVPFIELSGESVVEFGMRWIPILDKYFGFTCQHCEEAVTKHTDIISQIAEATAVPLPDRYFRSSYTGCWKCGKLILVFSWPHELFGDEKIEALAPRTIQSRYSRTAGTKYTANTCPFCDSIQGDFYLYCEPDGPFFGFNVGENTEQSYKEDMKRLAILADRNY